MEPGGGKRSWPRWLPWLLMGVALAAALTVGIIDNDGPSTPAERANGLARTIRCPQCQGETVAESNVALAATIRADIRQRVDAGESDREIRQVYADLYGESVLLTPPSDGFGSALWIVPIVAFATAATVLWVAWRQRSRAVAADGAGGAVAAGGADAAVAAVSAGGASVSQPRPAPRRLRPYVAVAAVAILALVAGFFLARSVGFRSSSDEITGDIRQSSAGLLTEAAELSAVRDFAGAIQAYDQVLLLEPSNVVALSYKGWLIWVSSESASVLGAQLATADVAAGLVSDASPEATADTGPGTASETELDLAALESFRLLSEAVATDSTYADARVFLAIIYANAGRYEQAAAELAVFYTLDPPANVIALVENPVGAGGPSIRDEVLLGLQDEAVVLLAEGRAETALSIAEAILGLDSNNVFALVARGSLLTLPELVQFEDVFSRGLDDLDRAASLSSDPQVFLRRAQALIAAGIRLDEARADLEAVVSSSATAETRASAEGLLEELERG